VDIVFDLEAGWRKDVLPGYLPLPDKSVLVAHGCSALSLYFSDTVFLIPCAPQNPRPCDALMEPILTRVQDSENDITRAQLNKKAELLRTLFESL